MFNYNLAKRFSVGYRHMHQRDYEEKLQAIGADSPLILEKSKTYDYRDIGIVNFRYYFWNTVPFYLTAGISRTYIDYRRRFVLSQIQFSGDNISSSNPTECYYEYRLGYDRMLGLGFQWLFENRLTFGFEYFSLRNIKGGDVTFRQIHYSDNLSLSSLFDIYYKNQQVLDRDNDRRYFEISLGYSF